MQVLEMPGCCAVRLIGEIDCLGYDDAFSRRYASKFDTMKPRNGCRGQYNTVTMTVIGESEEEFEKQKKVLLSKGYKLLATFKGHLNMADWDAKEGNTLYLYGSKEFKRSR